MYKPFTSLCLYQVVIASLAKANRVSEPRLRKQRNTLSLLSGRSAQSHGREHVCGMGRIYGHFCYLTHIDVFSRRPGHCARSHMKIWEMSLSKKRLQYVEDNILNKLLTIFSEVCIPPSTVTGRVLLNDRGHLILGRKFEF